MALRDEIKDQHKSIADKGFKYKLNYFVEYYKWHVVAVVIALIVIFSFIKGVVTAKDDAFYAISVNALTMPNTDSFGKYLEIDTSKEKIVYDTSYAMNMDGGDPNSYVSLQKLVATISAGTSDVMVGDSQVLENLAPNEFFADLRDYFSTEELDELGDNLIYTTFRDDEGNPVGESIPVLIRVTDTPLFASFPYFVTNVDFGIIVNTKRPEAAMKFYQYINDPSIVAEAMEGVETYG